MCCDVFVDGWVVIVFIEFLARTGTAWKKKKEGGGGPIP